MELMGELQVKKYIIINMPHALQVWLLLLFYLVFHSLKILICVHFILVILEIKIKMYLSGYLRKNERVLERICCCSCATGKLKSLLLKYRGVLPGPYSVFSLISISSSLLDISISLQLNCY